MTHHNPAPSEEGDAPTQAAYWDARLRNPDCSPDDRARFESWRAQSAENEQAFEHLQDVLEGLREAAGRPMLRALRDDAVRYSKRRTWAPVAGAIAAAVVLAVGVWSFNADKRDAPAPVVAQGGSEISALPAHERSFATAVGERSSVRLEDGSVITLNTQSRVNVRYTPKQRLIALVSGEALFDVAHDAARPFIVRAGDRSVRAIGTEFNVRLDGDRVRVVLIEGRVEVERRDADFLATVLGGARQDLSAGQQLISDGVGAGQIRPALVDEAVLWREGRVAFRDVALTDAVREMNRYSPDVIVVSDPSMARLKVNGVFRTGQMTTFLNAVREYFPIDAREQENGDVLLVWRE